MKRSQEGSDEDEDDLVGGDEDVEDDMDEDDDEDHLEEDESERPMKRSKTRAQHHDDDDLDDEDDEDEEEDDDEEYKERYKPPPSAPKLKKAPHSSSTAVKKDDDDDDKRQQDDDNDDDDSSGGNEHDYRLLVGHGEHKRAVSSVKFAPARIMKKERSTCAICASSSADGYIKLWNVQDHMASMTPVRKKAPIAVKQTSTASSSSCFDKAPVPPTTPSGGGDVASSNNNNNNNNNNNKEAASLSDDADSGDNRTFLEPSVTCGGHTRGINDISWNPVSPYLASASDDKTVRLWDMVTGDALVEYRGHDSFVFCVDQYQHMIVSGSFDETVKLWDIRSGDCVSTLPAHSDPVTSVSFNRDGTVVCTASHDGLIRLWDVATGECLKTIYAAGNPPVCHAKFSPNSKYVLAGTLMDATLRLWPVHRTGSNLCAKSFCSPQHHTNVKYSIVCDFTHDGNIVTGSETGQVIVYDLQSQAVQQVLNGHDDAVLAVSAHDKLPLLASGAMMNDRRVQFWAKKSFQFQQ